MAQFFNKFSEEQIANFFLIEKKLSFFFLIHRRSRNILLGHEEFKAFLEEVVITD